MTPRIHPALLTLVAAGASAQMSMPKVDTRSAYKSTIDAAYGNVSSDSGNYSGSAVAARLYFYGNTFVSVGRNDVSYDITKLKEHQFTYGIGTTEAWGRGTVTATYAHGSTSGDLPGVTQNLFSVGYELGLSQNLTAGLTIAHTLNAGDVKDVTATIFSARYEIAGGFSVAASYASQDTLLGASGATHTWTVGARYSF